MTNPVKKKGLDKTIFIGLGAVILVVAAVIFFRLMTKDTCPDVVDFTWTGEMKANNPIQFSDISDGANQWKWDFGDGSPQDITRNPTHTFINAQVYMITLYINGKCEITKEIKIEPNVQETIIVPDLVRPVIEGPEEAMVGESIRFNCPSDGVSSYEWQFGESMSVDATTKDPQYSYKRKGSYKVTLIVNGKSEQATHTIKIKAKPGAGVPGGKPKPTISADKFFSLLRDIADRKIFPESLNSYFCDDLTIPLTRPDGKQTTLLSYCNAIRKVGLDAKGVFFNIDKESGCITSIKLN
ncbi:MAG: PKD domain-containing protein [Crocinitomicaceae bacterium]|nr:PKD domain-containing protein [Crocinitomicaceae bacterium]